MLFDEALNVSPSEPSAETATGNLTAAQHFINISSAVFILSATTYIRKTKEKSNASRFFQFTKTALAEETAEHTDMIVDAEESVDKKVLGELLQQASKKAAKEACTLLFL